MINQVSNSGHTAPNSVISFIQMLNPSQYSQLMSMLNAHLIEVRVSSDVPSSSNPIKVLVSLFLLTPTCILRDIGL